MVDRLPTFQPTTPPFGWFRTRTGPTPLRGRLLGGTAAALGFTKSIYFRTLKPSTTTDNPFWEVKKESLLRRGVPFYGATEGRPAAR